PILFVVFFFSSRRRHTRFSRDWSSDVCSSDLSSQTAKATDEISAHISAMQRATSDTVAAIQGIGGTIGQISEIAKTIATAVDQQIGRASCRERGEGEGGGGGTTRQG